MTPPRGCIGAFSAVSKWTYWLLPRCRRLNIRLGCQNYDGVFPQHAMEQIELELRVLSIVIVIVELLSLWSYRYRINGGLRFASRGPLLSPQDWIELNVDQLSNAMHLAVGLCHSTIDCCITPAASSLPSVRLPVRLSPSGYEGVLYLYCPFHGERIRSACCC